MFHIRPKSRNSACRIKNSVTSITENKDKLVIMKTIDSCYSLNMIANSANGY